MKRLLIAILFCATSMPVCFARQKQPPQPAPVLARVTVYWASGGGGSDRYTRQHKCAIGTRLQNGHCAVDPRKIPYGSKIIFPDGTSLDAVDTGTAVKNRKAARLSGQNLSERSAIVIDRFFETKRQALAWANTHPHFMSVRVFPPNYRPVAAPPPKQQQSGRFLANNTRRDSRPPPLTMRPMVASSKPAAEKSSPQGGR